jgi:Flp pilus assembly protein TadG
MEAWRRADLRRIRRLWAGVAARYRALDGDSGSALVELALVVALLGVPLLLGTAQMGFLIYDSIEVSDAANAGALYGMRSSTYSADNAGMTTAAQADAADFGTKLSVTPTSYYVCALAVNGTQYTGSSAQQNATAACTGAGNHALQFVQVNTSATVTPLIHCPGLPKTYTLTGQAGMEVER